MKFDAIASSEIKSTHSLLTANFTRRRRISHCKAIFHPPVRVDLVEKPTGRNLSVFLVEARGVAFLRKSHGGCDILLRFPKKSSGSRLTSIFSTAATPSPRCICHRQRSARSPPDCFLRSAERRPVAAPILNNEGKVLGAISIVIMEDPTSETRIKELGNCVNEAAMEISRELGFAGTDLFYQSR